MDDEKIKQAFEDMSPSPEATDRMLANILAKTEKATVAQETDLESGQKRSDQKQMPLIQKKKRSPLAIVIPLAACLLLLSGIGFLSVNSSSFFSETHNSTADQNAPHDTAAESDASDTTEEEAPHAEDTGLAQRYPIVASEKVGRLYLVDAEGSNNMLADPAKIGEEIEQTTALSIDGSESIACIIYEYSQDDLTYYALQYAGDDTYYFAVPFVRE